MPLLIHGWHANLVLNDMVSSPEFAYSSAYSVRYKENRGKYVYFQWIASTICFSQLVIVLFCQELAVWIWQNLTISFNCSIITFSFHIYFVPNTSQCIKLQRINHEENSGTENTNGEKYSSRKIVRRYYFTYLLLPEEKT